MTAYQTEEEQIASIKRWWEANGKFVIIGLIVVVATVIGTRAWQNFEMSALTKASAQFDLMMQELEQGREDSVLQRGADIVKTFYTGDIDSFAKIVKSTPVPIVIAGGPKAKTDLDILQMTEDAMAAGAKGVTYGRNIFAHKTPEKMVEALAEIIFRKGTAKEAMKKIE